jgi:hypothetical protein
MIDKSIEGSTRYPVLDKAPLRISDRLLRWETILLILLAAVIAFNATRSPYFLDVYNLSDMRSSFGKSICRWQQSSRWPRWRSAIRHRRALAR